MSAGDNINKKIRKPTTVENILLGCTVQEVPKLVPGVLLATALVVLFGWLTNLLNAALGFAGLISYILVVILAGILIRNTVGVPAMFNPGISFCLKKLLRLGIILMGFRLSIFDVFKIGVWGIPIVAVCVVAGLVITTYFGRLLKLSDRLSTLIAVGTSICGASAIVAIAPGIKAKDEEVSYAVANITLFGIIAMVAYPFLAHWMFSANTTMAGLFTGTAIHETAQVAGSGVIYDQTFGAAVTPTAADVAVVTKLVRNVLMALVIPLMVVIYSRRTGEMSSGNKSGFRRVLELFPLFILGFLLMAALRSLGDAGLRSGPLAMGLWSKTQWTHLANGLKDWSGYILAAAMTGVGLGTSFKSMIGLGIKPFYIGLFAAVLVGVVAVLMVFLLGTLVTF